MLPTNLVFFLRAWFFSFSSKKKSKKKIRRIIDDAELGKDTRTKIAIEKVFNFLAVAFVKLVYKLQKKNYLSIARCTLGSFFL